MRLVLEGPSERKLDIINYARAARTHRVQPKQIRDWMAAIPIHERPIKGLSHHMKELNEFWSIEMVTMHQIGITAISEGSRTWSGYQEVRYWSSSRMGKTSRMDRTRDDTLLFRDHLDWPICIIWTKLLDMPPSWPATKRCCNSKPRVTIRSWWWSSLWLCTELNQGQEKS